MISRDKFRQIETTEDIIGIPSISMDNMLKESVSHSITLLAAEVLSLSTMLILCSAQATRRWEVAKSYRWVAESVAADPQLR
jgi:hypothetical protein